MLSMIIKRRVTTSKDNYPVTIMSGYSLSGLLHPERFLDVSILSCEMLVLLYNQIIPVSG